MVYNDPSGHRPFCIIMAIAVIAAIIIPWISGDTCHACNAANPKTPEQFSSDVTQRVDASANILLTASIVGGAAQALSSGSGEPVNPNTENFSGTTSEPALQFGEGFSTEEMDVINSLAQKSGLDLKGYIMWRSDATGYDADGTIGSKDITFSDSFFKYPPEKQLDILIEDYNHTLQSDTNGIGPGDVSVYEQEARNRDKTDER